MSKAKKLASDALSWLLCICLVIGWGGVSNLFLNTQQAHAVDVGVNPTPKVDIAVSLPNDYPGTFLDFKAELTEKLLAQGMSSSDFRITDTATKIDTTDTSNWVVYDHYYNKDEYNKLGYTAEQEKTHPYRAADNSCIGSAVYSGIIPMSKVFGPKSTLANKTTNKCCKFITHTYSYDDGGKANMVFAGYGTNALVDYMYYPATAQVRRTVSFDLDASVIDKHTLDGAGFLFNCGIDGANLNGYVFYIVPRGSGTNIQQTADAYIYKLTNWGVNSNSIAKGNCLKQTTIDLGAAKKIRISMDIQQDRVTVQSQPYDSAGNLIGATPTNNFLSVPTPAPEPVASHGGFGPIVGYGSHGCASLSVFKYLDLEMAFDTSAFDALKTVQYYQKADQKYFINLADQKNESGIPEDNKDSFKDGIDRMDQMETFYLSNADDGKVLRDSVVEDGVVKTLGLGATNGCIATGANYIDIMAQYIYQNFLDGAKFQHGPVTSPMPLANFYVKNMEDGSQLMTVHLKHLDGGKTVSTGIVGGSHVGTAAGEDGYIKYRRLRVFKEGDDNVGSSNGYNLEGKWQEFGPDADLSKLYENAFAFDETKPDGKYIFELTVADDKFNPNLDESAAENLNHVSSTFQTYVIAFKDGAHPLLEGANTSENIATFTITDTGPGIDEDGITFLTDNRGSGVKAYYITDKAGESPMDHPELWNELPSPQHSIDVEYELTSTNAIYVWSMDECGNVGYIAEGETTAHDKQPAIFQPTKVRVEDADGNPIKEYYVIGDKPIIVLPPDDEVPDPEDPENQKFAGWVTPTPGGGTVDVTPGTESGKDKPIKPDDNHTIVIRPNYSTDKATISYLGNGGEVVTPSGSEASYEVVAGSSIMKKMNDQGVTAKRKGYSFTGWKLFKGSDPNGDLANVEDVSTQVAAKDQAYYLVAQWEVGKYGVLFNPNGGSIGSAKKIAEVPYGTAVKPNSILTTAAGLNAIPTSGRALPNRPGCFFMGWSTTCLKQPVVDAAELNGKLIAKADGDKTLGITVLADPVSMGEEDLTLYAAWMVDSSKITVTLDYNDAHSADEESTVAYQEYGPTSVAHTYANLPQARRSGYIFQGWHLQNADGSLGEAVQANGVPLASNQSHTLVAVWAPDTKTRYTVDYYINSGAKDALGNFVYNKVNHESYVRSYEAPTESTVSVSEKDKLSSLDLHGVQYWYNPDSAKVIDEAGTTVNNNVLSGKVTGSPTLSLKLYYDRYLDVVVQKSSKSTGDGTVTSVRGQKEGSQPTATWEAADGSFVSHVLVNGIVRDDLKNKGSYTPEDGLHENTVVTVVFEKGADTSKPGTPTPSGPKVEPRAYTVSTYIHGCTTSYNGCSITPTQTYKAGDDVTLTLERQCNNCKLLRVEVDGKAINVQDHKIEFKNLSSDHVVDVYMTPKSTNKAPTLGGKPTEGSYSITVNRYGGDKTFYTSSSKTIALDDVTDNSWTFKWDQKDSAYRLYNFKVNGLARLADGTDQQKGELKLDPGQNYVVDVYFWDKSDNDQDGDPENVEPDFSRPDQWVYVTTEIVGGAGEIDPGFAEKKAEGSEDKEYEVNYTLKNSSDYTNPKYMYYDLEKVEINNKELSQNEYQTSDEGGNVKVTLKPTTADDAAHVRVTVKPIAVLVETMTVSMVKEAVTGASEPQVKLTEPSAGGTISASKSVGKYGNYTEIEAEPKAGYTLKALEVADITGQTESQVWMLDENGNWVSKKKSALEQWDAQPLNIKAAAVAKAPETSEDAEATDEQPDAAQQPDNTVTVAPEAAGENAAEAETPAAGDESAEEHASEADASESAGFEDVASSEAADEEVATTEALAEEPEVAACAILLESPAMLAAPRFVSLAPEVAQEDDNIGESGLELAYAEGDPSNGPKAAPNVFQKPVTTDGVTTAGYVNLTDRQRLVAYFATDDVSDNEVEQTVTKPKYDVKVEFEGAGTLAGSYTGAGFVDKDGNASISVSNLPAGYEYDGFSVDNPSNATVTKSTGTTFDVNNVQGPVTLTVKLKKTDTTPIETPTQKTGFDPLYTVKASVEGYGGLTLERKPSSNTIKKDGKYSLTWSPKELDKAITDTMNVPCIVSFTVNGVEQNQYLGKVEGSKTYSIDNVNEDYDIRIKTVLLNEDTDGDGEPDRNIDKDNDGKPDVNVDTDADGMPDTNIDTDDDGEPDVNVDTDGDGKPDKNIYDEDFDGTPDNVDPKNPPKPNVNVEVPDPNDPDKKIVLNEDTDGDGKPDKNIVDEDLDGKPDPVDPKNPPKPNVNVVVPDPNDPDKEIILNHDTDGDGIPDLDIVDADGDGKPDSIDPTDPNPPAPNVNVDTDKDGKPDLFIDVDHDFLPDVNIDTDKDGRPDINIDTDGDLEPDVNIDTDGTNTWYPSSRGGNADKIWKPYKNIDTGDGNGPIHTDTTAAVDEDKNGVDDRWKPEHNTAAANGFEYDTMAADWVDDGDLSADPGAKDPDNGSDPSKSDKGDKSDSNDKSDKSDNDKGKTKLAQTSDDLLPSMAFTGMMALTALAVCFWAWRRGNRSVRGKHAR